jgi:hypothetical protein
MRITVRMTEIEEERGRKRKRKRKKGSKGTL